MNPTELQPFLDVAISVLDLRDAGAAAKLKAFLMSSPGPTHVEQSLGLAVIYFAEHKPFVFDWIVSHQDILSPELELKSFTRKMVRHRLLRDSWVDGEDFVIGADNILVASHEPTATLNRCFSKGEMALIKIFFYIDSL